MSIFADVDNTMAEPHSQRWFIANGASTKFPPDVVLVQEKDGEVSRVVVVELSCVREAESDEGFVGEQVQRSFKAKGAGWKWTTTMETRRASKCSKYLEELMNEHPQQ